MSAIYRCPVCHSPLITSADRGLVCENQHVFDRHKKGYVNLLLAQNKRSKQPGDDKAMVAGRSAFLQAGYYQPLVDQLQALIEPVLNESVQPKQLLDAGCGEGYYLNALSRSLPACKYWGFDISKPAILQASRYKQCEWAVASTAQMPYLDSSVDVILSVFSRVNEDEFLRVLKPQGKVVFVGPGQDHLMALRRIIYPEVKAYDEQKQTQVFSRLKLEQTASLNFSLHIDNPDAIQQLLGMTPHGQRIDSSAAQALAGLSYLDDEADFRVYVFQKLPA